MGRPSKDWLDRPKPKICSVVVRGAAKTASQTFVLPVR